MTVFRTSRSVFLAALESVSPGLATRELIQQGTCFVFSEGKVHTFNDEISCWRNSPIPLTGAVKAKGLLDLLSKLNEDEIEVEATPEELQIRGKGKKAGIRMEADVLLPIESVDSPDGWAKVDAEFAEAVNLVHSCASSEESTFVLTCVHLSPEFIEATDRYQIARFPVNTGLEDDLLVRAESLKKMTTLDMTEMCVTDSWLHFRNPAGLHLSCRKYKDDYPALERVLADSGDVKINLPGGLKEVVDRCQIFSAENAAGSYIVVEIRPDRVILSGEGPSGYYKEMKKVTFDGEPVKFSISPKLLIEITEKSNECSVATGKLCINTGKFVYMTCTNAPEKE